jgi:hypothetical protein
MPRNDASRQNGKWSLDDEADATETPPPIAADDERGGS